MFCWGFAVCSALSVQIERVFHFIASIQAVVSCHIKTRVARVLAWWMEVAVMKVTSYVRSQAV